MTENERLPHVAIIIAAYNAENTIARAIRSALTEPEVAEVIVVDDGSTDNTVRCAQEADDGSGRLRILEQPKNEGPSAARNRAIQESASPWIGILDADDFFLPGRIRGLLDYADNSDLVADDLWQVPENNIDGPRSTLLGKAQEGPRTIEFKEFVLSNLGNKEWGGAAELGFIKPIMRRSFLNAHSIHYQENMRLGEDYELYARTLANGARLLLIPAQGYVSVKRANSLSVRHSETDLLRLRDCDNALQGIPALSKEDRIALQQHYLSIDCRAQWRLLIKAVKEKDMPAALRTFLRPWPVPLYNMQQLVRQIWLRTFQRRKK